MAQPGTTARPLSPTQPSSTRTSPRQIRKPIDTLRLYCHCGKPRKRTGLCLPNHFASVWMCVLDLLLWCLSRSTLMHMAQTYSCCSLRFTLISRIAWIHGRKRRACFTQAPARRGVSEARVEPTRVFSNIGGPYCVHYHAHNAIACVEATAFSSMTKFMDELRQHKINDVLVTRQDEPAAVSSPCSAGSSFLCS